MLDHVVYRAYDKTGQLLYVGTTSDVFRRLVREHRQAAAWWTMVDRLQVEHFRTQDEARRREAELIKGLRPPHNRAQPSSHPQIADALREQIRDGTYPVGAKLPAERALCDQWGVAGGTARAAIAQLRDEGLVTAYQGRGVYVRGTTTRRTLDAGRSWQDTLATAGNQDASTMTVRREPCPPEIAEQLGIPAGELVTVRDQILQAEGEPPSMILVSWHPDWIVQRIPDLADPRKDSGTAHKQSGLRLYSHDTFAGRCPTDTERDRLELQPGDVVTEQTGVTYDQEDRAVYAVLHVAAGHRIEVAVEN